MKIAITTTGQKPESALDSRFGRAALFMIYDLADDTHRIIDNQQNLNAAQGAGIQAAETVVKSGAEAVITGHCGPKAFRVLSAAGINVFLTDSDTVAGAIEQYRSGKLTKSGSSDVDGHWV